MLCVNYYSVNLRVSFLIFIVIEFSKRQSSDKKVKNKKSRFNLKLFTRNIILYNSVEGNKIKKKIKQRKTIVNIFCKKNRENFIFPFVEFVFS